MATPQSSHALDKPADIPAPGWLAIARRTWNEVQKDNVGLVAAGVAFYFFLALVPLIGATVLTYGLFTSPEAVARQAAGLAEVLPREAARLVGDQLAAVVETSSGKKGVGLLAAIALAFWGARSAAGGIVTALNIAYEEEETRGFVRTTLLALAMTAGAVAMAGVVAAVTALLAGIEKLLPGAGWAGRFLAGLLSYAVLGGIAAAAAATLYRFGPSRAKARWVWLTPGSIFFAAVWLVLTLGFGFYVRNVADYGATYGSLSAPIVLLTWLYLSSMVLIFGAELNNEVERQARREAKPEARPEPVLMPEPVEPKASPKAPPRPLPVLLRAGAAVVVAASLVRRLAGGAARSPTSSARPAASRRRAPRSGGSARG
jgi:membrane protein